MLRKILIGAAAAGALAAATIPAQAVEIRIGPGGLYVGPSYYYGDPYYYEPAPYGYYTGPDYTYDRYDRYPYETQPGFGGTLDYPDTGS